MEKYRANDVVTGGLLVGEVKGAVAVVLDDLISTGGTLLRAGQACQAAGATRLFAAATHGLFTGGSALLDSPLFERILIGGQALAPAVRRAFRGEPLSHRTAEFLGYVRECRAALCQLTGAPHAALLPGSGTLANEVVAAQIALLEAPGVVVSHGEFGERLADHARRARLAHHHWQQAWGHPLDLAGLASWLDAHPETKWLWAAHCETSTGAVTPIDALLAVCEPRGVRLCLDCVSSLGVLPVDLRRVHLASSTSGKGLAAVAGIGVVFHREPVAPSPVGVPRALDLGLYASDEGVPFTLGSNVLAALHAALHLTDWQEKHARVAELGARLRGDRLHAHLREHRCRGAGADRAVAVDVPGPSAGRARGGAALAFRGQLEPARPAADVAHAVVEAEDADAVGMQTRPSVDVEASARDAQQGGLRGEVALVVEFRVELLPGVHGTRRSELIGHADVSHVPTPGDQPVLEGLQVAGELAHPEPGLTRGGLVGHLQGDGLAVDREFLDRGGEEGRHGQGQGGKEA